MFAHQSGLDYTGYLYPTRPIAVGGGLYLGYVGIGSPSEFRDWERGPRRGPWSPVMVSLSHFSDNFNDPRSIRVTAASYGVSRGGLTFAGRSSRVGPVSLRLAFTPAAHAILSRHENSDHVVARGALSVGSRRIGGVPMGYTVGD